MMENKIDMLEGKMCVIDGLDNNIYYYYRHFIYNVGIKKA